MKPKGKGLVIDTVYRRLKLFIVNIANSIIMFVDNNKFTPRDKTFRTKRERSSEELPFGKEINMTIFT